MLDCLGRKVFAPPLSFADLFAGSHIKPGLIDRLRRISWVWILLFPFSVAQIFFIEKFLDKNCLLHRSLCCIVICDVLALAPGSAAKREKKRSGGQLPIGLKVYRGVQCPVG